MCVCGLAFNNRLWGTAVQLSECLFLNVSFLSCTLSNKFHSLPLSIMTIPVSLNSGCLLYSASIPSLYTMDEKAGLSLIFLFSCGSHSPLLSSFLDVYGGVIDLIPVISPLQKRKSSWSTLIFQGIRAHFLPGSFWSLCLCLCPNHIYPSRLDVCYFPDAAFQLPLSQKQSLFALFTKECLHIPSFTCGKNKQS